MVRANLKRLHRGWSHLTNRMLRAGPRAVELLLPGPVSFWFRPGTTDLLVLEQVFLEGEYDHNPIDADSVEYIVDCGSNIGVTALLWGQRFPRARMALVEPNAENFGLLRRNTESLRDRSTLIQAGVAGRDGPMTFYRSAREYGHSTVQPLDCIGSDQIPGVTVPTAMGIAEFPRIDLLKLDIEGGESEVMATIASWPQKPRFIVAELHAPYDETLFAAQCSDAGLRAIPGPAGSEHLAFAQAA